MILPVLRRVGRTARTPTLWLRQALLHLPSRNAIRSGPSKIDRTGLFTLKGFAAGQPIGPVGLGAVCEQDRHSLMVGSKHRTVKKPWRYMNHSCTPTASLKFNEDTIDLIAAQDLRPYTELTIDYNKLLEDVGSPFECKCPRCQGKAPQKIGG